jgi:hypothetical protein
MKWFKNLLKTFDQIIIGCNMSHYEDMHIIYDVILYQYSLLCVENLI